jgi:hypothetical protein
MLLSFEIVASILVLVTLYEYLSGIVIDLAFIGVLARRQHSRVRLVVLLLTKLAVWIISSGISITLLTLETENLAKTSVRQTFLVLFLFVIVPLAVLRKPYAKWVTRTSIIHTG